MLISIKLFVLPETKCFRQYNCFQKLDYLLNDCCDWIFGISVLSCVKDFLAKQAIYKANFLAKIPFLGMIFSSYYEYYLTSNLAIMLQNGLDLRKIVQVFAKFKERTLLFEIGQEMDRSLKQGIGIEQIFKRYYFVSNELVVFLSNGSTNEMLAKNLRALSRLCFQRLIKKSERLISLIQPTAFVIIGITIVVTYLKMLLPLYHSMENIY